MRRLQPEAIRQFSASSVAVPESVRADLDRAAALLRARSLSSVSDPESPRADGGWLEL